MSVAKKICLLMAIASFAIVAMPTHAIAAERAKASFAWGADAGGSIDMSANDMSSADFSASFGFKRSWINFLGVGAGVDIMVSNSARSFPVYVAFNTNFSSKPTLLFLALRAGVSANYLPNDYQQTGAYTFAGVGVNLASGKNFSSHLIIGYTFKEYRDIVTPSDEVFRMNDVHSASVKLGVTF